MSRLSGRSNCVERECFKRGRRKVSWQEIISAMQALRNMWFCKYILVYGLKRPERLISRVCVNWSDELRIPEVRTHSLSTLSSYENGSVSIVSFEFRISKRDVKDVLMVQSGHLHPHLEGIPLTIQFPMKKLRI